MFSLGCSRANITKAAAVLFAAAFIGFFVGVSPALAWEVIPGTRLVTIIRASTDASGVVSLYTSGYTVSAATMAAGTWDNTTGAPAFSVDFDDNDYRIDVALGYSSLMVKCPGGDTFVLVPVADPVYVVSNPNPGFVPYYLPVAGSLTATVTSMPPVSLGASVSVAGTLPVEVVGDSGESISMLGAGIVFLVFCGMAALGYRMVNG